MNTEENPLVKVTRLENASDKINGRRGSRFTKRRSILHVEYNNKDVSVDLSDIFRLNFPNSTPVVEDLFKAAEKTRPSEVRLRFMTSGDARVCSEYMQSWISRVNNELIGMGAIGYKRKKPLAFC